MYDIELEPEPIGRLLNYHKLFEIVKVSVDLGIYARITSPLTAQRLSQSLGIDERFLTFLLETLSGTGLVERTQSDGESWAYQSTPVARQYLSQDSLLYLGRERFQEDEPGKLLERFIKEGPSNEVISNDYWTPELIKKLEVASLLGGVQSAVKHVNLAGRKRLLDIGGGHGLYSIFFTKKHPELRACVLDLPQVIKVTNENIKRFDAGERVHAIAGDYHTFSTTRKFDAVFLSNVTPSPDELRLLLNKSRSFLSDGGIVILRSFVYDSTPDVWSAAITLERYARRGRLGFARNDLRAALHETEFTDVTDVFGAEGVVIICATKRESKHTTL
ncbi:MAG TPA: class I SAM-dependent methyltransferase [Methylococcales bacterium]